MRGAPDADSGQVLVIAPEALQRLGASLGDYAGTPRQWLGLGEVELTPMTLVLVADADGFARWSRGRVPRWGAGLTVPGRRLVVIRVNAGDPEQTLRHELAHLAFYTRIHTRVPLWFSEGYAALAAGEHGRLDALQLNLAVALGRVPSLERLDLALRGAAGDAGPAYALAASAVADIARRHPSGSLEPLLDRLIAGESFAEALVASTGLEPPDFGEKWYLDVRHQYNLGVWLVTGGAWTVLAFLLGFLVMYRRQQDQSRRMALDTGWSVPPDDGPVSEDDVSMTTSDQSGNPLDHPESPG